MSKVILTAKRAGITQRELEYCLGMLNEYGYVVKLKAIPEYSLLQHILTKRKHYHVGEDCMGQRTVSEREDIQYGLVQQGFLEPSNRDEKGNFTGACWFFVKYAEDYAAILDRLPDLVEEAEPFTITISSGYGQ